MQSRHQLKSPAVLYVLMSPPLSAFLRIQSLRSRGVACKRLCGEIERSILRITTMSACQGIPLGSTRHVLKTASYVWSQQVLQHTLNFSAMLA